VRRWGRLVVVASTVAVAVQVLIALPSCNLAVFPVSCLALPLARVLLSSIATPLTRSPHRLVAVADVVVVVVVRSLHRRSLRSLAVHSLSTRRVLQPIVSKMKTRSSSSSLLLWPPPDAALVLGESRFVARAQTESVSQQHRNGVSLRRHDVHNAYVHRARAYTHCSYTHTHPTRKLHTRSTRMHDTYTHTRCPIEKRDSE